ncbi:VPS10 domain-containing protein [Polaribacter gochangensis]|uniref:VPS10 domain-containing protein n=1 Tax=Polaribacter gochangensis TaxID=3252903 RepID=UPI003904CB30
MKKITTFFAALLIVSSINAQQTTSANQIEKALNQKDALTKNSIVKNIKFTNIGPTVMSGRVADLDVNPNDPTEFYVGYASGGLWHTKNNGITFTPIMDTSQTQNIGDIAVDWKSNTIWVGTGEKNSSRSSYAGIGVLKSTDNGKTWENVGLTDSHHVSRIIINPNNSNEVLIAVIGHLYSSNTERGIFKTIDGGKTWSKKLYIDENTGFIDIEPAPNNFNVLYAASWERDRKAWNFVGSGSNSAIYKSVDGGENWKNISGNGFPTGSGVGRIGLAVYDENTVYALHDSQFEFKETKGKNSPTAVAFNSQIFQNITSEEFVKLDNKEIDTYLKSLGFHEKYRALNIKNFVQSSALSPGEVPAFLQSTQAVTAAAVTGAEVFMTTNGGKSWKKKNKEKLSLYSSYGYYFGEIRVDPQDKNAIYILGITLHKSKDAGQTFTSIGKENVHSDHQAFWINPKRSGHLINGNDGGVNMSYDDGESWSKLNYAPVGQYYSIFVDNEKPYNVYGGLQDNGVWYGPNNARIDKRWEGSGQNPHKSIMGGDGMQVQVDSRDHNIVYTGSQFGSYFRLDLGKGTRTYITPKSKVKGETFRFNWQTPILLSPHNQDIVYFGSNKLHRSLNQGNDWSTISDDLTSGEKKGNVAYGTLTTISESPFKFGMIYVGSDDGHVNLTKDGGNSWQNISGSFPKNLWVSRVIASAHKKERVYVTLNGYRWDDFTSYVYMSDDYGVTWKNIGNNIPTSPVNVIKEDPENEHILYLGTDNGLYVTFDNGGAWHPFSNGFPNVAVHDLVIQKRDKDLVVGTHGRSIYRANISKLQSFNSYNSKATHLFEIETIRSSSRWGSTRWGTPFTPEVDISVFSNSAKKTKVSVYAGDVLVNSFSLNVNRGFTTSKYDVSFSKSGKRAFERANKKIKLKEAPNGVFYLPKGKYTVKVDNEEQTLEVK